ncbi:MAG: hypothetical protein GY772_21740 [bacterium]|nr:hypothetical protein [bacterium]
MSRSVRVAGVWCDVPMEDDDDANGRGFGCGTAVGPGKGDGTGSGQGKAMGWGDAFGRGMSHDWEPGPRMTRGRHGY